MENLLSFEIAITLLIQALGEWLTIPMKFFTAFGQEEFFIVILPLFYWCIDINFGISIALVLLLSNSINSFLKFSFHTPRPYWLDTRVKALAAESSFGFPSNHAQIASSLWGLLFAYSKKIWLKTVFIVLVLLIGISRIYLGVHFFHDVLAGWLIGIITIIGFLYLKKPTSRRLNQLTFGKQLAICIIGSLFITALIQSPLLFLPDNIIPTQWIQNASQTFPDHPINPLDPSIAYSTGGIFAGFSLGALWLKHHFRSFSASGTALQKVLRYMVGTIGTILLWYGMKNMYPSSRETAYMFRYFRYFLLGLWISALAPLIFDKLGLSKDPNMD